MIYRYDPGDPVNAESAMIRRDDGEYVKYEDYDRRYEELKDLAKTERELEAKFDRLREALKEAVAWIEDGRFDDDYISEEWYHMAIKALEDESNEIPWEKALTNLGDPRLA